MNLSAMNLFLSYSNIKRHLEHMREEKLRYSILEKSLPQLKGKSINQIIRLNIDRNAKDEAIKLLWYIKSHDCFFDSFAEKQTRSDNLLKFYSSAEKFLYDLYVEAVEHDGGFMYIYFDRQGVPKWIFSSECDGAFIRYKPVLALDLYEHSYFLDYGFNKRLYLRNALSYLNLASLDNRVQKGYNEV